MLPRRYLEDWRRWDEMKGSYYMAPSTNKSEVRFSYVLCINFGETHSVEFN